MCRKRHLFGCTFCIIWLDSALLPTVPSFKLDVFLKRIVTMFNDTTTGFVQDNGRALASEKVGAGEKIQRLYNNKGHGTKTYSSREQAGIRYK